MEKIVIDTNFLMAISDLKIDVFEGIRNACNFKYQLYVLEGTLEELESFIKGSLLSKRQAASFAKKVLDTKAVKVLKIKSDKPVDNQLLALDGYIVATVDRSLRQGLKKKGVKVLTIRQKKHVVIE
ncbi:MAG: hypothetical protein Q8Q35_03935 [Nanoarchaeota archaeon]|nr:hypothetical protein [Nanoarchaeota archaeon]